MNIQIVNKLPTDKWRTYVEKHPDGGIFHTPEMFDLFAGVKNHIPNLWAAIDGNQDIQAMFLPIEITLKTMLRPLTTRAVVYGSILYEPTQIGKESLWILLKTHNERINPDTLFTELRNSSDLSDVQPVLELNGFVFEPHLNYLIDLNKPIEEVMQNIGKRTRKQIRSGLSKQQIIVRQITTKNEVKECYDLISKSYAAAQVPVASLSFFEAVFEKLSPKGMVKIWLAKLDGVCVASSIELSYKNVVYGWYSGVDRDYSKHYPGELLMWHVLQWSVENGYTVYDFGGAGKPDEEYGVRDFKAKFGGELVNYGRNICIHRPKTLQVSKIGYEFYRRLM
jgi:hypothetical protein